MIYRLLMLPITIMILLRAAYAERQAALELEYFCECPRECVLHETIQREQGEMFKEIWTAVTCLKRPEEENTPGDYLQEMRELECTVCEGTQRLEKSGMFQWRKYWDEGTAFGWCPECWPAAQFKWMGCKIHNLDSKRLHNIIMAIERGTWATSGSRVDINKRLELHLRYEYAKRDLKDGDIVKIEMENMKWEANRSKKHREKEEAAIRADWAKGTEALLEKEARAQRRLLHNYSHYEE